MLARPTMNTRTDERGAPLTYELSCVDCPFERTVEGDAFQVLDVTDAHRKEHRDDAFDHFVEFEATVE